VPRSAQLLHDGHSRTAGRSRRKMDAIAAFHRPSITQRVTKR
jgi:hypothetical protein